MVIARNYAKTLASKNVLINHLHHIQNPNIGLKQILLIPDQYLN
jgi:hypothetical protein